MYYKNEYKNRFRILKGGLISLVVASNLYGAPSGGTVVSGTATINQSGNTTNINQSSNKAIINWQDFSIKSNETVNFNQPNVNSITLNRVIGNEKSIIDGALNANGQVWLVNSNGVLFGKNAKVNTAGIVASTKDISNEDFNNGNYNFKGNSKASIVNEGEIKSLANTHATFIANSVTNKGKIEVHKGTINLIGASDVTLTLNENQNLSLKVNKGVLDALVDNQNLLIANGGQIYLTTNAKDELLKGVVNNSGIIEANSLDELTQSEVILFAHGGTTNVDGSIIAKGGFVETSGEKLNVTSNTKVVAKDWLLDPTDILIASTGGDVLTGDSVSATAIQNNLETTNVHLQATNNITVNQAITWSTDKQLKLEADNINVNATINNTNSTNGGVYFQAANTTDKVVFDTNGKVIVNNVYQLQWMNTALNGKYELGSDINAGATKTNTANWGTIGFNPLGDWSNSFKGMFDGLGHTISDLYINRNSTTYVGLFGYINSSSTVKNIGLTNVDITGNLHVGGLAGENNGLIQNSYSSGSVNGDEQVGGLVGRNWGGGRVQNSYSTGTVEGNTQAGGLVGRSEGSTIENSYSNGSVNGDFDIGGLVGLNDNGTITNSYATGTVNGDFDIGGLVGLNEGTITNSYASGSVTGTNSVGGLFGWTTGGTTIENSFYDKETNTAASMNDKTYYGKTKTEIATALKNASSEWETDLSEGRGYGTGVTTALPFLKNVTKLSNTLFEDGHGTPLNPYKITNWTQLQNINNSNILTQNYYFNLLNNISSSTSDYTNLASNTANGGLGWNPIGNNTNRFTGTFDGLANTISDLYINRKGVYFIGLFGHTDGANIKNIGVLDATIAGNAYVAGLVGYNLNSSISNTYVIGEISIFYNIGGGIVGENAGTSTITDSYSTAKVTGGSMGGLIGLQRDTSTISNSFWDSDRTKAGIGTQNSTETSTITGKTSKALSYGKTFKDAGWDILADSTVTSTTPIIKYDTTTSKYVWAIAPLSLSYVLSDKSTEYNGQTQSLSSLYTNVFGSDYSFITEYEFQVGGSDVTGYRNAGTYSDIKVVSTDDFLTVKTTGNTDGKHVINKKALTVSDLTINDKVYDANTSATLKTVGTIDKITSDDVSLSTTATFNNKNVENVKTVNLDYTLSGEDSANYSLSDASNVATSAKITAKALTVSDLTINDKVYDANTSATLKTVGTIDKITSDDVSLSTTATFNNKNVENVKTVNLDYTLSGEDSANYSLSDASNVATSAKITKANAVITATSDDSKVYTGLTQTVSGFTASGLVNGETISVLDGVSGASASGINAGTYKTVLAGTDENYNLTFNQGSLEITKADATITANSDSKVYNGLIQNVSGFTVTGLVNNEDKSVLSGITGDNASGKDVGVYNTALAGTDTNYNLTFEDGKLTITKADLTATLNDNSKTYDGTSYSGGNGITFNGFVNGETASLLGGNLVYSGTSQGAKDAGNYIISGSGLTSNNYNISFVDGKLTINQKPKVDEQVQKVIASIEASTNSNSNSSSNQSLPNSLNSNIRTLSFNGVDETRVINGGVKMPENIANEEDIIK